MNTDNANHTETDREIAIEIFNAVWRGNMKGNHDLYLPDYGTVWRVTRAPKDSSAGGRWPCFSFCATAAMLVVDKMLEGGWGLEIHADKDLGWRAAFKRRDVFEPVLFKTFSMAICRAALVAKRKDANENKK